jgi:nitroimidazol reductase NimA-like FMN-containing flavoprotein (pyridoxamine 5'-phosphate oxidase superfamily)
MTAPTVLDAMDRPTCEAFLANESVGRLAVVVDDVPHILPVNYAADGATVVFRTAPGTFLTEASMRKVAFEVDHVDEHHRSGWSVCVHGFGRDITDAIDVESERLRDLIVDSWAPSTRDIWFKIIPTTVTGRYLGPGHGDRVAGASN